MVYVVYWRIWHRKTEHRAMKLTNVNHLAFITNDLTKTIRFWRVILRWRD